MSKTQKRCLTEEQKQRRRELAMKVAKALAIGGALFSGARVQAHGNASSHATADFAYSPSDYVLVTSPLTYLEDFGSMPVPPEYTAIGEASLTVVDEPRIFSDGFESGNTSAWSNSSGAQAPALSSLGKDLLVTLGGDGDGVLFTSPAPVADGLQFLSEIFLPEMLASSPGSELIFTYFTDTDSMGNPTVPRLRVTWSSAGVDLDNDGLNDLQVAVENLNPALSPDDIDYQLTAGPAIEGHSWSVMGQVSRVAPYGGPVQIPFAFTGFSVVGNGLPDFRLRLVTGTGLQATEDPGTPTLDLIVLGMLFSSTGLLLMKR